MNFITLGVLDGDFIGAYGGSSSYKATSILSKLSALWRASRKRLESRGMAIDARETIEMGSTSRFGSLVFIFCTAAVDNELAVLGCRQLWAWEYGYDLHGYEQLYP